MTILGGIYLKNFTQRQEMRLALKNDIDIDPGDHRVGQFLKSILEHKDWSGK